MPQADNLKDFFTDIKKLLREYAETRLEIYRLQAIRIFSRTAGYFLWIFISIFLLFLVIIFGGLVLGFWLSSLTGSFVAGFGITTLVLIAIILLLLAFRNALFVNPIIHNIIKKTGEGSVADRQDYEL